MVEISVRAADHNDSEVIAEFNCCLAAETEGKQLDYTTVRQGVRALLGDPAAKGRYFLAVREDGVPVGQVMHTHEWSDWRNGDIWWLQSVYVVPEYRQRGVFRQLYEHVLEQARQTPGVAGLRLYVEDGNESASRVYERLGMRSAGYSVMERIF